MSDAGNRDRSLNNLEARYLTLLSLDSGLVHSVTGNDTSRRQQLEH